MVEGSDEAEWVGSDSLSLKIWNLPEKQNKRRLSEGERDVVMSALYHDDSAAWRIG